MRCLCEINFHKLINKLNNDQIRNAKQWCHTINGVFARDIRYVAINNNEEKEDKSELKLTY